MYVQIEDNHLIEIIFLKILTIHLSIFVIFVILNTFFKVFRKILYFSTLIVLISYCFPIKNYQNTKLNDYFHYLRNCSYRFFLVVHPVLFAIKFSSFNSVLICVQISYGCRL